MIKGQARRLDDRPLSISTFFFHLRVRRGSLVLSNLKIFSLKRTLGSLLVVAAVANNADNDADGAAKTDRDNENPLDYIACHFGFTADGSINLELITHEPLTLVRARSFLRFVAAKGLVDINNVLSLFIYGAKT